MSLEEDVTRLIEWQRNVVDGELPPDRQAKAYINKILDAVEDQADSLGWVSIEAINKLRPEK